jgi:hypothetical protein
VESFAEALTIEDERFNGDHTVLPHYPWNFFYIRSSRYDVQLKRYFALFSREQFLILSLADLAKNPQGTVRRLWDFLQVPSQDLEVPHLNARGEAAPIDAAAQALLDARLRDVTANVDEIIGEKLDWSM